MKKEIRYRLNGLEGIVESLHYNIELMKYMSAGLHKEPFNLFNNFGLYWLWGQITNMQLVNFYKVLVKNEKFSFEKIINLSKEFKCEINYKLLEEKLKILKAEYDETDYEKIRSKYIAHQDLQVQATRSNLLKIMSLTEKIVELFFLFSKEFKGRKVTFSNKVVKSFDEIFYTIDEYEWVKAFFIAEQIKGNETVKISRIAQVIKEHGKEIKRKV